MHLPSTWVQWLHAIAAAFIGGAAGTLSVMIVDPTNFNFTEPGLIKTAKIAFVAGLIPVLAYLKKYPTPGDTVTVTATVTKTLSVDKES